MTMRAVLDLLHGTCSFACWDAREDVCRCLCNGANHGINRTAGAAQPKHTMRVKRNLYELRAVCDAYADAAVAADAIIRGLPRVHKFGYDYLDKEAALAKSATPSQLAWAEFKIVAARKGQHNDERGGFYDAYGVWARVAKL